MLAKRISALALAFAVTSVAPAFAATKVAIGISGWTGFAPLTLAKETGIFEKHGLDVTLKKIPQASRHLAIASGDVQCAATTVETWISWNAAGVATKQIFQMDKSYGADGIVAKPGIKTIADLKGKSVAASAPGTSPYFLLAWVLNKNGLSTKDVKVINLEPGPAAQAFLAGQGDAAVSYEPYLSAVRDKPDAGHIIATTLDYPMVLDTVGCTPKFLDGNPDAAKALADSYFEALDYIKAHEQEADKIMGADVKQSAAEFADSAKYLRWADRDANKTFFNSEFESFTSTAADLLMQMGLIKQKPDVASLVDKRFIQ
ncbi:NitT/TauT family transport system substrate-binding protein [Faunimonas pinastri]|uniref:NitT/TauT family transport system substrate-binding protein n=1 Tax=Faunimonas pinastri TaxID=1855383 RepID=A0A1H8ZDM8_9HYPH|nr:ABC transporter substrate-binding protein [Faunimonas pinastri]SEP61848.1 NitT/TauT family transport system substrate-binding protein [Faunimonas pinastri]